LRPALETSASVDAPRKFVNVVANANTEAIPFDDAVGKDLEPCDIKFGKNAVQLGNSIREVIDADADTADIDFFDSQAIDEHAVSEFGYDITLIL
jgi:nucleoside 2-deoxyribosyltransferase